jgi:hypothetical protein
METQILYEIQLHPREMAEGVEIVEKYKGFHAGAPPFGGGGHGKFGTILPTALDRGHRGLITMDGEPAQAKRVLQLLAPQENANF